ncbi:3-hydroxyacyl-CoA dehydrogenase NAD-binding domain-containing protein [Sinomonas sp. R1AF57]|uniref:3-hydroxyacyl-CoA dehydrogenase NAD-binding domain-containing protein n=1 Tax=Sinomonas sp. R1AF57 TaxID=2020377 RepID=UPI000B607928|nr:3-hydroxyacyl-CoA dehydrogenase NAD-binding domain-containing protein [Sinomonas sp. R1AF57]ASN53515.1 3-hydroxyacyl-CoA dehydrogenase [Sinomonas sp. R1AF57]
MTDRTIAVVGTGLIGASWAAYYLARGFRVVASDPAGGAEEALRERIDGFWPTLETLGLDEGASRDRLEFTPSIADAARGADFVQENGPERLDIKRSILAEIEQGVGEDVLIATSSSGLLVSEAQKGMRHPQRLVLGHPFNPPHLIPLVEVLGGEQTSPENVERAVAFYAGIGKKPIRINREVPGHVANRLQDALWREMFHLVSTGVASVADIDTAISYGPGLRWALMGPFLTMHAGGGDGGITHFLEHLGPAMRDWARDLGEYPETDEYVSTMAEGVEDELAGHDWAAALAARDRLLLGLLAAKAEAPEIP